MATAAKAIDTMPDIAALVDAGFAIHWLHPREKRPIGDNWSTLPVATLESLTQSYRPGNNVGVRLGEFSAMASGGFLHVIDMDIRVPREAAAAWRALREAFPDVDIDALPMVQSGSGGESRHIYFVTDRPFDSKKIAHSGVYFTDATGKHLTWEIELFGTRKQVAMPPSIHPVSGKPYIWVRPFDFTMLDIGIAPEISSAAVEDALPDDDFESGEYDEKPCDDLTDDKVKEWLSLLDDSRWATYDSWYKIGAALHHQYAGGQRGLDIYTEISVTKPNYDPKDKANSPRAKWKTFGKNRRLRALTFRAVIGWATQDRDARRLAGYEDLDDLPPVGASQACIHADFGDLLGSGDGNLVAVGPAANDDEDPLAAFEKAHPSDALPWTSLLALSDKSVPLATLHNVEMIVRNDPRLVGLALYNEFTGEIVQRTAPGVKPPRRSNPAKKTRQLTGPIWQVKDLVNGDLWSEDRDSSVRSVLEAPASQGGYGVKFSDRDLKAALAIVARSEGNRFHPVHEYLNGTIWDGISRADRLFVDYVGAADTAYAREVARLMLVSAVARIFEPGCKVDYVVILEGVQGLRKSTLIRTLGRQRFFGELACDWDNVGRIVESMRGKWILELPELSGFHKGDVEKIKAVVTTQSDRVRLAYAHHVREYPRQSIFVGSTNSRAYVRESGARRWLPIYCEVSQIDTDRLESNMDQIWAEAVVLYRQMRAAQPHGQLPLYLQSPEAKRQAALLQESRRVEGVDDGMSGLISAWLDKPVGTGSIDDDGGQVGTRNDTCLMEIWVSCLGGDRKLYGHQQAVNLARAMDSVEGWSHNGKLKRFGEPWGRQRRYFRVGHENDD